MVYFSPLANCNQTRFNKLLPYRTFLMMNTLTLFFTLLLSLLLIPNSQADENQSAENKVYVYAASSLTNALTDIAKQYQRHYPNQAVILNFASSSTLARQIAQGAPADIYLSANEKWMDFLTEKHFISPNTKHDLLTNQLVLIANNKVNIDAIKSASNWPLVSFLGHQRLAIGDPDHVPAGMYAKQALQALSLWDQLDQLIARTSNVRTALALVERGETPLGIVYATDAAIAQGIRVVRPFPEQLHNPIRYPIGLIGPHPSPQAQRFYQYLSENEAKRVFKHYQFGNAERDQ